MKTQLSTLEIQVHMTATEKEARVLNLLASYMRHDLFKQHFSEVLPRGITPADFDGVMLHLHSHTGRVLATLDKGREFIATGLNEASS